MNVDGLERSEAPVALGTSDRDAQDTAPASGHALFVVPNKHGDGFRATVRGHVFELADPEATHGLVPTPDDLLTAAVAADVAWFTRRFLRAHGHEDYVTVCARIGTPESAPGPDRVDVTVEVSGSAAALTGTLAAALEHRMAETFLTPALRVRRA